MNIYFVDHSGKYVKKFKNMGFERIGNEAQQDKNPDNMALGSGLYLVHTYSFVDKWKEVAEGGKDAYVLFVSSQPGQLPQNSTLPERCCSCSVPVGNLESDTGFNDFIRSAKTGRIEWEKIFAKPYPEYLLACYLLDITRKELGNPDIGRDIFDDIESKVKEEYKTLTGHDLGSGKDRIRAIRDLFASVASE